MFRVEQRKNSDGQEYPSYIQHRKRCKTTVIFDSFQREPPPGFRGLHPDIPITFYTRHLTHWRQKGATYFVTFRLNDALAPQQLRELVELKRQWEVKNPRPKTEDLWEKYAREVTTKIEGWLDEGYGACYFGATQNSELLAKALRHYHETRCQVRCLVVMPNHAHAVMKPLGEFALEDTLRLIKGYVAHEINTQRDAAGAIWEQESYDRIIRDLPHLENVIRYIGRNGAKAKLPAEKYLRWIDPSWEAAGWGFEEAVL